MTGKLINMENYARREHFNYFRTLPYPYAGITADVNVTAAVRYCKARHASFYLLFMHLAALAADGVPELRQRIRGEGIIEYDECPTSHVELRENGTYCYCTLKHHMPLADYFPYAEAARRKCLEAGSIEEDREVESYYFISTVPWIRYTSIIQPAAGGDESNPRITWGKYESEADGRIMMPVTILVHHALADGIQMAAFYRGLGRKIAELPAE